MSQEHILGFMVGLFIKDAADPLVKFVVEKLRGRLARRDAEKQRATIHASLAAAAKAIETARKDLGSGGSE